MWLRLDSVSCYCVPQSEFEVVSGRMYTLLVAAINSELAFEAVPVAIFVATTEDCI